MAVSETLAVEQFHRWTAKTSSSVVSTEEEPPPSSSVLLQPPGVVTEPLQFNIKDGVRQVQELTSHLGNMDDPIDVGTAKEDRGLTMFISYPVS